MTDVTRILESMEAGDSRAAADLLPLIYDELRKMAKDRLANESPGQTLQATALVHEAFVRLIGKDEHIQWNGRGHFFGAAAEAMRRILIEQARRKQSQKHGGKFHRIELKSDIIDVNRSDKMLSLDDALVKLEGHDASKAQLVKLRFFAGLTNREAANALGISTATAERFWTFARAWLKREMTSD